MTAHNRGIAVPARITQALDAIGAEGAWVDEALGGAEPMVDDWEAGKSTPTDEQVDRLAALTKMPVAFFYEPIEPGTVMRLFMCDRSRRTRNALTVVDTTVDWAGVQHTEVVVEPASPDRRRPAKPKPAPPPTPQDLRGPHRPELDVDNPGCCRCGLPMVSANARHRVRRAS